MKIYQLFIFFLFVSITPLLAQNNLPLQSDGNNIKPLGNLVSTSFQNSLEFELMKNPLWKKLIKQKRMAVGVVDLSNPDQAKFASVNGNYMMYAASLPKIAILLAAEDAIDKKELKETDQVKSDLRLMISKSNNQAATRMIDRLGFKKIQSALTDPLYKFYDKNNGGGLWVGKRYAKGGSTNRESLKNLSHAATVNQVCRYYYMLANGELVSRDRSKIMLDILENPGLHHKFVNTLDKIAPDATLYRKSGSWKDYHSDSVLVWDTDPARRYIIVALINDPSGELIIRNLIKPVEKAINSLSQRGELTSR
ncbi:MAG: serine hydrolase [Flavobacteriaceae bacterium]|nr:serine hydrolase [Flavobacteriaceae bacterium]